jgi:3-deoxy-manno-octulosonate cytidylyltransferase (CMP-KDO synthetase)
MLADIGGKPLIVRTLECALAAGVGDVIVACDGEEIADAVQKAGGTAVLTDPDLPSGTDRVFAARSKYDPTGKYKIIINLQGDQPLVAPEFVRAVVELVKKSDFDISTPIVAVKDDSHLRDAVVKSVVAFTSKNTGKALYFSRSAIPFGGPYFRHVGIYCFRAEGLRKFVSLPPSPLEISEKLEQLRAIENGMTIGVTLVDADPPVSVDVEEDLEQARRLFKISCGGIDFNG